MVRDADPGADAAVSVRVATPNHLSYVDFFVTRTGPAEAAAPGLTTHTDPAHAAEAVVPPHEASRVFVPAVVDRCRGLRGGTGVRCRRRRVTGLYDSTCGVEPGRGARPVRGAPHLLGPRLNATEVTKAQTKQHISRTTQLEHKESDQGHESRAV